MGIGDLMADLYSENTRNEIPQIESQDSYNQMLSASDYAASSRASTPDDLTAGDLALAASFLIMGSGLVWLAYLALA